MERPNQAVMEGGNKKIKKNKTKNTGMSWHTTAHEPLSVTSQIWHQSLSDNSSKMGKLGESQPTHRLHHLSQELLGTHQRARTHARTHAFIDRLSKSSQFAEANITPNFLNTSHNYGTE